MNSDTKSISELIQMDCRDCGFSPVCAILDKKKILSICFPLSDQFSHYLYILKYFKYFVGDSRCVPFLAIGVFLCIF